MGFSIYTRIFTEFRTVGVWTIKSASKLPADRISHPGEGLDSCGREVQEDAYGLNQRRSRETDPQFPKDAEDDIKRGVRSGM